MVSRAAMRAQEASDRELLLNTHFTTNDAGRESETSIMIDRALEHQNALGSNHRGFKGIS